MASALSCFGVEVTLSCGSFVSFCEAGVCQELACRGAGDTLSCQQGAKPGANLQERLFVGDGEGQAWGAMLVEQPECNASPGTAGSKARSQWGAL